MLNSQTFYFYDLETSGVNPREQRVMQFAGQRTDMDLNPVGEPDNILVKITADVLPEPDAIVLTGITPQKTLQDGISEDEFLTYFEKTIAVKDTIFVGFNTVRFDDEFMRYMHYRNLRDPYAWQWKEGKSRWDLMDVCRMTRALRPDGIVWPFASDGRPANRLGLIASVNNLLHEHAHDALSDVLASIEVAKLIKSKQPKLFSYLLEIRDKNSVKNLVSGGEPFVYTTGAYQSEHDKTSVAVHIAEEETGGSYVFDLRYDPTEWVNKSVSELSGLLEKRYQKDAPKVPIKLLKYNKCPAVAPLGVLDADTQQRLQLNVIEIKKHAEILSNANDFWKTVDDAFKAQKKDLQTSLYSHDMLVDSQLYDGFVNDHDIKLGAHVRSLTNDELIEFVPSFQDDRLNQLCLLFKARQRPETMLAEDRFKWDEYLKNRLFSGGENSRLHKFMQRLEEVAKRDYLDADKRYVIEELALYAQSITPMDD